MDSPVTTATEQEDVDVEKIGEIGTTPQPEQPEEGDEVAVAGESIETPRSVTGRQPVKWVRLKKPLKELCNKIMVELRRKDEVRSSARHCSS
jgi:bromodomain-containing protein 7/9